MWVSPQKRAMRFEQKGKLGPHYIEPWDIVERVGPLAYRLTLSPELAQIHNIFYVSRIRLYRSDPSHVLKDSDMQISENLSYIEEPVIIVKRQIKHLWRKYIPMVKVIWKNHGVEEATWETEEKMRKKKLYTSIYWLAISLSTIT